MTSARVFRICRVGGHVTFWLLIVSTIFAGGLTWLTVAGDAPPENTRPYESFDPPNTITVIEVGHRATASSFPTFSQVSLTCAILFILAALGEAWILRRDPRGFVSAAVAVVTVALLWLATPDAIAQGDRDKSLAFSLVVAAVGLREIWFRQYAPDRLPRATDL